MAAERTPLAEPSLLARPLAWITRLVVRFPIATLALGIGAAVVALGLSANRLGFRTSRLDLINSESSFNRRWLEYVDEFDAKDDVVIVVEGAGRREVVPVLEKLADELQPHDRLFQAVLHEVDLSRIRQKGLYYVEDPNQLREVERFLFRVTPIVRDNDWARLNLGNVIRSMNARLEGGEADEKPAAAIELDRLSASLLAELEGRGGYRSPWPEMSDATATLSEFNSRYILIDEGRIGLVFLRLAGDENGNLAQDSEPIDALRKLVANVQQRCKDPDRIKIGLTGLPVMENDEMQGSQASMLQASLLALVGVACLFVAGFGGVRHPLMTVAALLLAMSWSFGYITLAVGHLNILSISFGVILIGLGIDFGVHYVARYLQLCSTIRRSDRALVETARGVGPGILTGAVTTAIAFLSAGLTEFTGVAELGMIAGGGILLCLVAALTVLPAMIHLADRRRTHQVLPVPLDLYGWLNPLFARPGLLLGVTLAGTATVGLGMSQLWYDHNLLNLQPEGVESVELQRKLLSHSDEGLWFALSITNSAEEAKELKEKFDGLIERGQLPAVDQVKCLAEYFPSECEKKRPFIERIHARLATLPERTATIPVDRPVEVGRLLARAQALIARGEPTARARQTYDRVERVRRSLRLMSETDGYRWLAYFQQRMAGDLLNRLHTLREMADPEPPRLDDLPEGLVARFVARDKDKYLLQIYPKGDIWDMKELKEFVRQIRSVDPNATGNPLQTYEASLQMQRSYKQAAWYALAAILMVLYADFRSLRHTLLAMVPLGLGMLQLFGMLGLLGIPLNPANMIVLPLILGIGIDDGVHVIHDFRRQTGRYRMSPSTASGVLITSLTTMVGFGSLMIASHRGLQSLGRVLTIGVSCCLFTSLVMLPALLALWTRHRPESPTTEHVDTHDRSQPQASDEAPIAQRPHRRDPTHTPSPAPHTPTQRPRIPDKTW